MSEAKKPLLIVAGTRPEAIKLAPIFKWLERLSLKYIFVWSGQHYDYALSKIFFEQLKIPDPDENLDVRSGTHAEQTAKIMVGLERLIKRYSPKILVSEGDTNTVVASSLASLKCLVPFAHVEAGLRSWNMCMPEEINRKIADTLATLHFAPTELAAMNLLFEGNSPKSVYVTGNTIVDMVSEYESVARKEGEKLLSELGFNKCRYILATVHRAENTENPQRLKNIVMALGEISQYYDVLFPVHPRTRKVLMKFDLQRHLQHIRILEPLGYFEFLGVLANARVALTDSGGVQEEAFTLRVPAVILRYNTERPETTMFNINVLSGADKERIVKLTLKQAERAEKIRRLSFTNPLGDGFAGKRIAQILEGAVKNGLAIKEPDLRETPVIEYKLIEKDELECHSIFDLVMAFKKDGRPTLTHGNISKFLAKIKYRFEDEDRLDFK
jgi:UDP-N-acetylglucosamine 2-epimerase (non-hydrolysing)